MTYSNGRHYLATPGPSIIPDRVLQAMHRPAPDIYKGEILDITKEIKLEISSFANTAGRTIIYISNGHGVWEASIVNLFKPGDKILIIVNGHFGTNWANLAANLGVKTEIIKSEKFLATDIGQIEDTLRADREHTIKGLLVVHSDTSTSVKNDLGEIGQSIKRTGHPCLFLVDAIASFGCDRIEMDQWGIDLLLTGCQRNCIGVLLPV